MHRSKTVLLAVAVILALVVSPGCVTKKLFRDNADKTDTRVRGVENMVEDNERRISDLSEETDAKLAALDGKVASAMDLGSTAMTKADQAAMTADKAARGKLLWSVTLTDENVRFSFNGAELTDEAKQNLAGIADRIKGMGKEVYLEIEGHTDNIGSEDYNHDLGEQRAMAVLRYLNQGAGIPLHAMNAISYGESAPVADNGTRDGRAQNRRVVIRVLE